MSINVELLSEVQQAKNVGDVVNVISRYVKAFGDIERWSFSRNRESRELCVFVSLERKASHAEMASSLGGIVTGDQVCFLIPQFMQFEDNVLSLKPPIDISDSRQRKRGSR
jgi:hypothetical protein